MSLTRRERLTQIQMEALGSPHWQDAMYGCGGPSEAQSTVRKPKKVQVPGTKDQRDRVAAWCCKCLIHLPNTYTHHNYSGS